MGIKQEIIKTLQIEIKHLNSHLGDEQIKMFQNQSQNKKNKGTTGRYLTYKTRNYQTKRIINLINEGWKNEKKTNN